VAKSYKYDGILGKPRSLKLPLAALLLYPDDQRLQQQAIAALKKQDDELFDALFADCGIRRDDPLRWKKLSKSLVGRHVPAFQPFGSRGRGRPSGDDWPLAEEVVDLMKTRNLSVRSACAAIAKRRHHRSTAKQIENRFYYTMRSGKAAKAEVQRVLKKSRCISHAKTAG
jgi:hypothetical protein